MPRITRRGASVPEWCRRADPEQDDEGQQEIEDQQPLRSQCREVGFREQASRDTSVAKAEDRQLCRQSYPRCGSYVSARRHIRFFGGSFFKRTGASSATGGGGVNIKCSTTVTKPPAPALAIAQITSILKKPTRKSLLKPRERMRSTWLRSNYFVSERMLHEAMNAIAWHGVQEQNCQTKNFCLTVLPASN